MTHLLRAYDHFNALCPPPLSRIGIGYGVICAVVTIVMLGAIYVG